MSRKKVMKLASRGKRFGAGVIDSIVPFIGYTVMMTILAANGLRYMPYNGYGYGYGYGFDYGYNYGNRLSGGSVAAISVISLLMIVYLIVELVFFAKGKSIGKAMLGLQVVSSIDGKPFRFWMMVLREFIVKSASGVLLLGYIWILIDDKNRAWHDKILDTYVVDLRESEQMRLRKELERAEAAAYKAERTSSVQPEAAVTAPVPAAAEAEEPAMPDPAAAEPEVLEPVPAAEESETVIEIETVDLSEAAAAVEEIAAEAMKAAPAVSMAMKKEELLEAAREAGAKVSSKATKAEIIEAIEKASENK